MTLRKKSILAIYLIVIRRGFDHGLKLWFSSINVERPDSTMNKVTRVSDLNSLNWKYSMGLGKAIKLTYDRY